jgi:hypothetical protein
LLITLLKNISPASITLGTSHRCQIL